MTDPTDSRSKAEASHRLAEIAKTPRARELFRQLAAEYEQQATGKPNELAEAAPPLVPLAPVSESEQWVAGLKRAREST